MGGLQLADLVYETTNTTGTGTLTLLGAFSSIYQPFSVVGDQAEVPYRIDIGGTVVEIGKGKYTLSGTTLSRDKVIFSTNGNALVNLPAGIKNVRLATLSEVVTPGLNASLKNPIINGNFDLWQRGTSFAAASSYNADRWAWQFSGGGAGVVTVSQSTSVLPTFAQSGVISINSLKIAVTTVDSSIGASDVYRIQQPIEIPLWKFFDQQPVTVSFWVRAAKTGTYCVAISDFTTKSCVIEYTINSADTWEKKTVTFPASPALTASASVALIFTIAAGSNFQGTAGSYQSSGSVWATSNQVNGMDSTSNTFYLSQVQVETGPIATPFERRTIQQELELAQRYYEKSYDLTTNPGTVTANGQEANFFIMSAATGVALGLMNKFKVRKRNASSTITMYSPATGASGKIRDAAGAVDVTPTVDSVGETGFRAFAVVTANTNVNLTGHWTADNEI